MVQDEIAEIEKRNELYSYRMHGFPIWDGIRYNVISLISEKEVNEISGNSDINRPLLRTELIKELLSELWSFLRLFILPIKRKDYLFFISSRFKEGDTNYDRQIAPFLSYVHENDCLIIEYHQGAKYSRRHYSDASPLYYRIVRKKVKPEKKVVDYFVSVINDGFGKKVISNNEIEVMIGRFMSNIIFYEKILNKLSPKKIIITYGRFKAICAASSKIGIPVYLMQHALVFENDYALANTCPQREFGFFPNVLLTFGNYWGQYMKKLVNVQVLGNHYLSKKIMGPQGEAVLFISTPKQGVLLGPIAKRFAESNPQIHILYRLHPSEYAIKEKYMELFCECSNIDVITNESSFEESLTQSRLVVGIFSTALYEALHQDRIIAVLDDDAYQTYLSNLKGLANVYFFTSERDLLDITKRKIEPSNTTFFEPLKEEVIRTVLNE